MEASALARASGRGLLARRSPLLRFESDDRLVALIRAGHDGAFEALFNRYNARLLGFCQSMLKSRQDAEDVLQEVFANAHSAMLKDERAINLRPWLYRIARNRCLNHLRRPVPEGQDSMDIHPHQNGTTTAEQVQNREELRQVLDDVRTLPETQRTALLLREIDQLSYEEMAVAMDTTVPAIKSLLVRARIALAESSQARMLTCDEVRVELAEAAEGIGKATGPVRKHVRSCAECLDFRNQLRRDRRALAALFPIGPLALLKGGLLAKLFGGGSAGGSAGAAGGSVGTVGSASAAGGFSGSLGALGGAIGVKAAAGLATAALITAGAVEVRNITSGDGSPAPAANAASAPSTEPPAPAPHDPQPPQFVAAAQPAADEPRDEAPRKAAGPTEPEAPVEPDEDVPAEEEPDSQAAQAEEPAPEIESGEEGGEVAIDDGGEQPDPGSEPVDPGTEPPPEEEPPEEPEPPTEPSDVDQPVVKAEPGA